MAVVTIGEVVVDWISTVKGAAFDEASHFFRSLGGNATNVAVGLSRLGSQSRLIGKIGADIHGQYLRRQLELERVNLDFLLSDVAYPTAQCYCVYGADDDYAYYNWPFPNAAHMLRNDEISLDAFSGAWVLHSTGISLTFDPRKTAVLHAMNLAKSKGLLISYDACFPTDEDEEARNHAMHAVRMADLLKVNLQELLFWSHSKHRAENFDLSSHPPGEPPPRLIVEQARLLYREFEPLALLVTLGHLGSLIITAFAEVFCPPINVDTIAPVGAGDAYIAGIIHAIAEHAGKPTRATVAKLSEKDWQEIGRFANAVGALTTTRIGACDGMPRAAEVATLLQRQ